MVCMAVVWALALVVVSAPELDLALGLDLAMGLALAMGIRSNPTSCRYHLDNSCLKGLRLHKQGELHNLDLVLVLALAWVQV